MLVYAYPIFLTLFLPLLMRRYKEKSGLQWTARWFSAIEFSYGATVGLVGVSILLFGPILDSDFELPTRAYWYAFTREAIGLAIIIAILGAMLYVVSQVRGISEGASTVNTHKGSLKKAAWLFTILFLFNLALGIFLIIRPYIDSELNAQAVYQATHNFGLDPRNWFPFSFQGIGNVLYQMAFWVWAFAAFFLVPIAALQWLIVKQSWVSLQKRERVTHVVSIAGSMLLAAFVLTVGTDTLFWLID